VKTVFMAGSIEAVVETWESKMTDPLRIFVTLKIFVESFRSDCISFSNCWVLAPVHDSMDLSAIRNTKTAICASGVGGGGAGLLHALEFQFHVDSEAHRPSSDPKALPLLQVPREAHQPQAAAEVQVPHVTYELQK